MRKHSKFITILLSALLAVCLMQTVFVQAFATENSATPDEPTDGLRPVSMEVVKVPKTVNLLEDEKVDSNFWSDVVLHIVYSDGREFDVNCNGIDSEDGIVPPIAELNGYAGHITAHYDVKDDTVDFSVSYWCGDIYEHDDSFVVGYYEEYTSVEFSVDIMRPVSMEIVKAPESIVIDNDEIIDSTFWSNVVVHIVYNNGEEYDVNCDGADSEDGIVPPIAEIGGYQGRIYCYFSDESDESDESAEDSSPKICVTYSYDDFAYIEANCPIKRIDLRPVSMEVVKMPKTVTMFQGEISDSSFWDDVVVHIVYSDGREFDVNCDGFKSGNEIVPPIPEINGYKGYIGYYISNDSDDESDVESSDDNINYISLSYRYGDYDHGLDADNIVVTHSIPVEVKDDPRTIVKCEVTKLPDKVFTAPFSFGSPNEDSISRNIDGMEVTFYYANGEKGGTVTFNSSMLDMDAGPYCRYVKSDIDKYGNYLIIEVQDKGDYKFSVDYLVYPNISTQILTAKSASNPNPSLNPVSTEDTPTKPSDNISSATSDVATKDNAGNNNTTNGTANNGVVATGNFATPAIIATVMILAAAVMFVLKRKHTF